MIVVKSKVPDLKFYLFAVLLLAVSVVSAKEMEDPFSDDGIAKSCPPPQPKRGYMAGVPFFETPCEIVSIHAATIEYPLIAWKKLRGITELDTELPHVNLGDEVYNITSWFPLHEMSLKTEKEEKRWVYYNRTNGYIIANADQFLRSSIYDYVKEILWSQTHLLRMSVRVVRVSDQVNLNMEAISKSSHQVLWRSVVNVRSGDRTMQTVGGKTIIADMHSGEEMKSAFCSLELWMNESDKTLSEFHVPLNQWIVSDFGLSGSGERDVILVRVEVVNPYGDTLDFTVDKSDFMNRDFRGGDDPFVEMKFHMDLRVPPDLLSLISVSRDSDDGPFGGSGNDLNAGDQVVDISSLLEAQGVPVKGIFYRNRGIVSVYSTQDEIEMVIELLDDTGGGRQLAMISRFNIYEIDAQPETLKRDWTVEDMLVASPVKVASFGGISNDAKKVKMKKGESHCEYYVMRDETGSIAELSVKFDLHLPKIKREIKDKLKIGKPKVIYLGESTKNGRAYMILINVSTFDDDWYR